LTSDPSVQTTAGQEELKRRGIRPWPLADESTKPFWDAATDRRLMAPRCDACRRWQWPPAAECGECGSVAVRWVELSGGGTVYSFIVDHRNMVPGFEGAYIVALVVPDEVEDDTVRLVTNLPGCPPEDVRIGMKVSVTYEDLQPGVTIPQFVPVPAAGR
jgi:uncharacterized OB-fold protein